MHAHARCHSTPVVISLPNQSMHKDIFELWPQMTLMCHDHVTDRDMGGGNTNLFQL